MPYEEHTVAATEVRLGMYVARLDRPWAETPFPLQGFVVESFEQIDLLRRLCQTVVIDVEKSVGIGARETLQQLGYGVLPRASGRPYPRPVSYPQRVPLEEELPAARSAWRTASGITQRVLEDLRCGHRLEPEDIESAVEPVVDTMIRNPDAYFWLQALRARAEYAYAHALNSSALAVAFGRHLGFPRELLLELAAGGMLMDIGLALLPVGVYDHSGLLTAAQQAEVRGHVARGVERLQASGVGSPDLLEMIWTHHERHDGSGYPQGIAGAQIPLLGRMLGLVDTFDAMCSDRPYRSGHSRHDVLQLLYRERDRLFQGALVEQFSQCLGVYPTGTLVELSTGEVAVVMAQNPARRLFPRVILLTTAEKTLDPAFRPVDLAVAEQDAAGPRRTIVRALSPGAYGLDLSQLYL
jgi:HD-GYP domain-containing protein (c-di-GMP phosphodiesterase class II)